MITLTMLCSTNDPQLVDGWHAPNVTNVVVGVGEVIAGTAAGPPGLPN